MKKNIAKIAVGLTVAIVLALFSVGISAQNFVHTHCVCGGNCDTAVSGNGHTHQVIEDWQEVSSHSELAAALKDCDSETDVYLYLTNSFTSEAVYKIGKNQHVHLCLNGYTITAGSGLQLFELGTAGASDATRNATLSISDCSENQTGTITGGTVSSGSKVGGNVSVYAGGTFYLYGGNVANGKSTASSNGGNVHVSGGNFNMYGGKITGGVNTNTGKGGGNLYVEKYNKVGGVFNMYGGSIEDGQAIYGGNAYFANTANVHIYGGSIKNGSRYQGAADTTPCYGGNLCIRNGSTVVIDNALIEGGNAMAPKVTGYGGNIYIFTDASANPCTLTMNNSTVKDGKANSAGNFYVKERTSVTLNGCSVENGYVESVVNASGNTVGGFGGNIFIASGKSTTNYTAGVVTINDTVIKDGYANGQLGGNVCITTDGVFTMNSGLITGGKNKTGGQGGLSVYTSSVYGNGPVYNLYGGTITGNQTGVYLTSSTLHLKGDIKIKDNYGADIMLGEGEDIILDGALTGGEDTVGVTFNIGEEFAPGDIDASSAFFSDRGKETTNIVYDSVKKVHRVENAEFTDFNSLTTAQAANKKIDVYIIAGQSNAIGSTTFASAGEGERDGNVYPHVHYWCYRSNTDGTVTQNKTDYRAVTEGLGSQSHHIGPELGMAQVLEEIYKNSDREAVIFKYAAGGTSILDHATGVKNGELTFSMKVTNTKKFGTWWCGEENAEALAFDSSENRATGYLYRGFLNTFDTFYNDLLSKGFTQENINLVSLSWLQGETDRGNPTAFNTQFEILMGKFRDCFYEHTGNAKDKTLPVIVNEIASTFATATPDNMITNMKFIEMLRDKVGQMEEYYLIPTASLRQNKMVDGVSVQCGTDNAHYKYADQITIGHYLANASLDKNYIDSISHEHCECAGEEDKGDHTLHEDHRYYGIGLPEELEAIGSVPGEHYYYLTDDIVLNNKVVVNTDGVIIHLCLNGHKIIAPADSGAFGINTSDSTSINAKLYITDCSEGETGEIKNADPTVSSGTNGGVIYLGYGCELRIYGGTVTGGNTTGSGGNIYASQNSKFVMYGGKILDGAVQSGNGQNLFIGAGNVELYGGLISGTTGLSSARSVAIASKNGGYGTVLVAGDVTISDSFQLVAGTLTQTGGTVNNYDRYKATATITGGVVNKITNSSSASANGTITLEGGYFKTIPNTEYVIIKGGYFASEPAASLIANGYEAVAVNKIHNGTMYYYKVDDIHDFDEKWSSDAKHHWHVCKNEGCSEKGDYAFHTFEDGVCTVCGYEKADYITGDVNGDGQVTDQDAVYLLFNTFFPDDYPLNQDGDFNGDGAVTDQDAIYLLFNTFFPDDYPLNGSGEPGSVGLNIEINVISPEGTVDTVDPEVRSFIAEAQNYDENDYTYTLKTVENLGNMPVPVTFNWESDDRYEDVESAYITLSENEDMSDGYNNLIEIVEGSKKHTAQIYNLKTGTKYYWKLRLELIDGSVRESEVNTFTTEEGPRILKLDGAKNARDLGGWYATDGTRINQGLIYRTAYLNPLTVEGQKTVIDYLGVKTEIDLRNKDKENDGDVSSPLEDRLNYMNIKGLGFTTFFTSPDDVSLILKPFTIPNNYPIAYHCLSGADRTGCLSVLLGALYGVKENDLVADFEITNLRLRCGCTVSGSYIDFPSFISAFHALPGDTLQEKAYGFIKNECGFSEMEIYNMIAMMKGYSAVFVNPENYTVENGYAQYVINMRQSEGIKKVYTAEGELEYTYNNGTLKVNVSATESDIAYVEFNDGAKMPIEWK